MAKPLISVVLPTRNRSKLLPLAIKSVLDQTFGDFELIVSDNFSDDDTSEAVHSFTDNRVRYVRTASPLKVGHSFEFALSHARGEYVSFCSDDDAYTPVFLERAYSSINAENAEVIAVRMCSYHHNEDFFFNRNIRPNTAAFSAFSGRIAHFESSEARQQLYRSFGLAPGEVSDEFITANVVNTVFHRRVLEKITSVRPEIFSFTPTDIYVSTAVLFAVDRYYCLDEPLYVWSSWAENTTASAFKKGNELKAHYEKLLEGESLKWTPLKFALPKNCLVNTVLQARSDFQSVAPGEDIDWTEYFVSIYDDLMVLSNASVDVNAEMDEFDTVLRESSPEIQTRVRSHVKSLRYRTIQGLRRSQLLTRAVKRLFLRRRSDRVTLLDGHRSGFNDVLGAAKAISEYIPGRTARKDRSVER